MKKLLYKSAILVSIWLVAFAGLFALVAFGYVDAFYAKFTSPAKSLIIGNSRAAQGIMPSEFENVLTSGNYEKPLLNYAFTLAHSPFGPAYLGSIKRKLPPETKSGSFIIAVDPWSVTVAKNLKNETAADLPEQQTFINKLTDVNKPLNVRYLKDFYQKPYYRLVLDNLFPIEKLHKNGWLEIDVPMNQAALNRRTAAKLTDYRKKATEERLSELRLRSLEQTISYLQQHGRVFLIRIPVSEEMLQVETAFQPGFDALMATMAQKYSVPYLNYTASGINFKTIDGNHLYKTSAQEFSRKVAADILRLSK